MRATGALRSVRAQPRRAAECVAPSTRILDDPPASEACLFGMLRTVKREQFYRCKMNGIFFRQLCIFQHQEKDLESFVNARIITRVRRRSRIPRKLGSLLPRPLSWVWSCLALRICGGARASPAKLPPPRVTSAPSVALFLSRELLLYRNLQSLFRSRRSYKVALSSLYHPSFGTREDRLVCDLLITASESSHAPR